MSTLESESFVEELANGITHGIGLALSVVGLVVLVALSIIRGNAWHIAGCATFGVTLVLLYTASTLYHSFHTPRLKRILKALDHTAIYLLIAGTYTPFTLVNLRGFWGWVLFVLVWSFCVFGIVGLLFAHIVENVGMAVNLLPVTGIPLPFFSYGGSFLLTCFLCIGIALRVAWESRQSGYADLSQ